jgi:hypothetical protein
LKEQYKDIEDLALPISKLLASKFNPYTRIEIDADQIKIVSIDIATPTDTKD